MAQRRCARCGTNYESVEELHKGGACPGCGSYLYDTAVVSDYRAGLQKKRAEETAAKVHEWLDEHCGEVVTFQCALPRGHEGPCTPPEPGSTEDYLAK